MGAKRPSRRSTAAGLAQPSESYDEIRRIQRCHRIVHKAEIAQVNAGGRVGRGRSELTRQCPEVDIIIVCEQRGICQHSRTSMKGM